MFSDAQQERTDMTEKLTDSGHRAGRTHAALFSALAHAKPLVNVAVHSSWHDAQHASLVHFLHLITI